jgi:rare lipoprotein A (peptidoglycan hydrolase)
MLLLENRIHPLPLLLGCLALLALPLPLALAQTASTFEAVTLERPEGSAAMSSPLSTRVLKVTTSVVANAPADDALRSAQFAKDVNEGLAVAKPPASPMQEQSKSPASVLNTASLTTTPTYKDKAKANLPQAATPVDDKAEAPSTVEERAAHFPDVVMLVTDAVGQVQLRSQASEDGKAASVFINDHEVVRFRSQLEAYSPHVRAKRVLNRLEAYLKNDGTYHGLTVGSNAAKQPIIQLGEAVLLTVDADTAKAAGLPAQQLAKIWCKQLRSALGEPQDLTAQWASTVNKQWVKPLVAQGMASWYGPGFHGRHAADGSVYNQHAMTAAHKTLPFGTKVKVTNVNNGRSCVVRITDRGPFIAGRVLDVSKAAAATLGMLSSGVAHIHLQVLN